MPRGFLDEDQPRRFSDDADDVVTYSNATCIRQTEKAICVRIAGRDQWLPQSAVHDDSEVYAKGHEGRLVIKAWFARKEGLRGDG